jgi:hypothetical protein
LISRDAHCRSRGARTRGSNPALHLAADRPYRAARDEADRIAVREPTLPNGNPADETEEYAAWETARLKTVDVAAIAWTELATTPPTTVAGAIALINCYLEIRSEHPSKVDYREVSGALKNLRAFLRSIAQ